MNIRYAKVGVTPNVKEVRVNGKKVDYAIEADVAEGKVVAYKKPLHLLQTVEIRGVVEIISEVSPPEVTLVTASDWTGLYLDGVLVAEGHSISEAQVAEALGFTVAYATADEDWLNERGHLPQKLSEVKHAASR